MTNTTNLILEAVRNHELICRPQQCIKCLWGQRSECIGLMVIATCISEGRGFVSPIGPTVAGDVFADFSDANNAKIANKSLSLPDPH